MRLTVDQPSEKEIKLPAPPRAVYRVTLPANTEIHVRTSDGEDTCVKRYGGVLVIWTRKRSRKTASER